MYSLRCENKNCSKTLKSTAPGLPIEQHFIFYVSVQMCISKHQGHGQCMQPFLE